MLERERTPEGVGLEGFTSTTSCLSSKKLGAQSWFAMEKVEATMGLISRPLDKAKREYWGNLDETESRIASHLCSGAISGLIFYFLGY